MLIPHKGHTDTMQVYSVTVMTRVKALQAGHSSQGTSEPITPVCSQIIQFSSGKAFAMYQMCRVILMVFSAMPDNVPGIREWKELHYRLYIDYIKILKDHSMRRRFFYKMTNRANKIDKKCVNLDMEYNFFKWLWIFFLYMPELFFIIL